MYYERTIESAVKQISNTFPVLVLLGPRQIGKSTMLTHLAEDNRKIVSLDNPTLRALAKRDPELFLQRYAPPVLIDEIQYAPELLPYIKIHADKEKHCGEFWLTGSQTFKIMNQISEFLTGRAGILRMQGLSNNEINGVHFTPFRMDIDELTDRMSRATPMTPDKIYEKIITGSMPRLYENTDVNKSQYFESYLDTYLSRDIKDLAQIADETAFLNFMTIVAARTTSIVNYDTLANEADISAPTAKQWLSVLVSSGIVALISPYSNNALKRVIKSPRMYFLDTGLCAHLTMWRDAETLEYGAMSGAFFETWVVSEIYKSFLNAGEKPPLYFYRDSNKKEIDLIIYENGTVTPIEIKKGSAPKNATKNFSVLQSIEQDSDEQNSNEHNTDITHLKANVDIGAVICLSSDLIPIDRKNWYVPAWLI